VLLKDILKVLQRSPASGSDERDPRMPRGTGAGRERKQTAHPGGRLAVTMPKPGWMGG